MIANALSADHRHLARLWILAARPAEVHGPLQERPHSFVRPDTAGRVRRALRERVRRGASAATEVLPQGYRAQAVPPGPSIPGSVRWKCRRPKTTEVHRPMSRDPYPVDPPEDRSDDRAPLEQPFRLAVPSGRSLDRTSGYCCERSPSRRSCGKKSEDAGSPRFPRAHYTRERTYFLRDSELETLAEVGTFRVIAAPDLAHIGYGGDEARMEREIRRLKQQSLLSEKRLPVGRNKTNPPVRPDQAGFAPRPQIGTRVKTSKPSITDLPSRAKRNMMRTSTASIKRKSNGSESAGRASDARDLRLRTESENLNRDLAALDQEGRSPEALERIAERHGLSVVGGKIPVPDLRVEYDTSEQMERQHVDLELATRNYRPRALGEKAKAGFSLYARREDTSRLRRVLDESEITARILSL